MSRLRITEIFRSLQGEANTVGFVTTFVRLTGCPLRCGYCDTSYAFQGGTWFELPEIVNQVKELGASYVTVTGGEPLAQKPCLQLLTALCDEGFKVSLETSGALDVSKVDPRVAKVVDIKTPGSGEEKRNYWDNLPQLSQQDLVKFVICDRADYDWSKEIIARYQLTDRCEVLFSPSYHQQSARDLADWIVNDRLRVRFQIQLHKFLWEDAPGR